jgi:ketosteroid isomerase-like protein
MTTHKNQQYSVDEQAVLNILQRVMDSVHTLDYEGVRDLIPDDGLYFGSVAPMARGYQELYERQFTKVWPNISEFNMPEDSINVKVSGSLAYATCLFESGGRGPDGNTIQRQGRMTFVFECRDGKWVMVHSHDSLYPTPPGQTSS